MDVLTTVEETEIENEGEGGRLQPGVEVACSRCDHAVEAFGMDGPSLRRCAAHLRETCPRGERNFYIVEGA